MTFKAFGIALIFGRQQLTQEVANATGSRTGRQAGAVGTLDELDELGSFEVPLEAGDIDDAGSWRPGTVERLAVRRRIDGGEPQSTLSESLVYLFLKVARQRKGLALVPVREELCRGCHVRVMPTLIQQVRRAEGLIACDSCKRFMYVPDTPGQPTSPVAEPTAP